MHMRALKTSSHLRRHIKARQQCCVCMICNTPTPGHPSAADETWHWSKPVLAAHWVTSFITSRPVCVYSCSQLRELWFNDLLMYNNYTCICMIVHVHINDMSSIHVRSCVYCTI